MRDADKRFGAENGRSLDRRENNLNKESRAAKIDRILFKWGAAFRYRFANFMSLQR